MKASFISQKVIDALLSAVSDGAGDLFTAIRRACLHFLRRTLIRALHDPLIRYELDGTILLLPLSHQLPFIRASHPKYSTNVARIAAIALSKYPDLSMIDIGANIGDTVAIVRHDAYFPIMCIDGDPIFFSILEKNAQAWTDVYLVQSFVGDINGATPTRIIAERGTARLIADTRGNGNSTRTETLTNILSAHPTFTPPRLIKIDTDGFDLKIVTHELSLIERLRPIIFLEYDPYFFEQHQSDGHALFHKLSSIGYDAALIFDNTGEFLAYMNLGDDRLQEDIHHFYTGRSGRRYCDIAFFHAQDTDICMQVRLRELSLSNYY